MYSHDIGDVFLHKLYPDGILYNCHTQVSGKICWIWMIPNEQRSVNHITITSHYYYIPHGENKNIYLLS